MINYKNENLFRKIYDDTYYDILKYIIINCNNINDANDILQETYLELWKIINKKTLIDKNIKSFIIGIAINKIKKHKDYFNKFKYILQKEENGKNEIQDKIDIEQLIIKNDCWQHIWIYLKHTKNQDIPKIFYLHYKIGLSIKEISNELNLNESYVKNLIYRTIKKLSIVYGKENV